MADSILVVASQDSPVLSIYDGESMALLPDVIEQPSAMPTVVKFSADGSLLALVVDDYLLRYRADTLESLPALEHITLNVFFSPDNKLCAIYGGDLSGGARLVYLYHLPSWSNAGIINTGSTSSIYYEALAFSRDSTKVAVRISTGSFASVVAVYRVSDLENIYTFPAATRANSRLFEFTEDDSGILLSHQFSPYVRRYNLPGGEIDASFSLPDINGSVAASAYNHDRSVMCILANAASPRHNIFLYNTSDWSLRHSSRIDATLRSVSFSGNGEKIAVGAYTANNHRIPPVLIFDADTMTPLQGPTMVEMSGYTERLAFSPAGQPPPPPGAFWGDFVFAREQ